MSGQCKPEPNRREYILALRQMSGQQRLRKAMELTRNARALFETGLRRRFPDLTPEEFHSLLLKRLAKCHNRNW